MIPGKTYTFSDFLAIAWRRKWLLTLPFVVMSVGTYVLVKRLPNRYRSQTMILVVPQRVPDSYVRSTVSAPISDRLRSISEQILSRSKLEKVILDYNLYIEERKKLPMEEVVERMRENDIEVKTVKLDSFTISYSCGDARQAKLITERFASMFIDENMRDRVILADGTSQFLESQLDDARQRLVDHEKKLQAYRQRYSGELPSQLDANMRAVQSADMQLQQINESINRDKDRKLLQERLLADMRATDNAPAPISAPVATGATTIEQLETARTALADLETRLTAEHPDVVRAKRTVQELEKKVASEAAQRRAATDTPVTRLTPAEVAQRNRIREIQHEIENLNNQINEKQATQAQVTATIASYQRKIAAVPLHEAALTELMRDYETLQKSYTSLLTRKEESKTAADLERRQIGEQFKILDPAREPEKPFSPNRMMLDAMGAVLGLILGLGFTALLEYLDSTLKTEDDVVQVLMLPVLALIPNMPSPAEVRLQQRRRAIFLSFVAAGVVVMSAMAAWKFDVIRWVR
jgi:polysaccharide chain length determinant protein (PEP-CTERM system associated)